MAGYSRNTSLIHACGVHPSTAGWQHHSLSTPRSTTTITKLRACNLQYTPLLTKEAVSNGMPGMLAHFCQNSALLILTLTTNSRPCQPN